MAARFEGDLMAQGEIEEKKLVWGNPEQRAEAWAALRANAWAAEWFLDAEVERLYGERLKYSDVVADYEQLVRRQQLVLRYRLHCHLLSHAHRRPSNVF